MIYEDTLGWKEIYEKSKMATPPHGVNNVKVVRDENGLISYNLCTGINNNMNDHYKHSII